jgi:uncharacterized membrane protein
MTILYFIKLCISLFGWGLKSRQLAFFSFVLSLCFFFQKNKADVDVHARRTPTPINTST